MKPTPEDEEPRPARKCLSTEVKHHFASLAISHLTLTFVLFRSAPTPSPYHFTPSEAHGIIVNVAKCNGELVVLRFKVRFKV